MMKKKQVSSEDQILNAAVKLARVYGYNEITRDGVAIEAGVAMGSVNYYFGTMIQLRQAVMQAAIAQKIPEIIAQGLLNKDELALTAPKSLRRFAAESLI